MPRALASCTARPKVIPRVCGAHCRAWAPPLVAATTAAPPRPCSGAAAATPCSCAPPPLRRPRACCPLTHQHCPAGGRAGSWRPRPRALAPMRLRGARATRCSAGRGLTRARHGGCGSTGCACVRHGQRQRGGTRAAWAAAAGALTRVCVYACVRARHMDA